MFDEAEQREIRRILQELDIERLRLDLYQPVSCPCCKHPQTDLVDVAFVSSTGAMVKTGDTHQCPACYTYFVPGEGCEQPDSENFTP